MISDVLSHREVSTVTVVENYGEMTRSNNPNINYLFPKISFVTDISLNVVIGSTNNIQFIKPDVEVNILDKMKCNSTHEDTLIPFNTMIHTQ